MDVENKVPNVPGLVTTTVPNKKIREVGSKIPDTSWLATTAVINTKLNKVENKIPKVSGFFRKTNYDAKIRHQRKIFYYC